MSGLVIGLWVLVGLVAVFVVLAFIGSLQLGANKAKANRFLAGKHDQGV